MDRIFIGAIWAVSTWYCYLDVGTQALVAGIIMVWFIDFVRYTIENNSTIGWSEL